MEGAIKSKLYDLLREALLHPEFVKMISKPFMMRDAAIVV